MPFEKKFVDHEHNYPHPIEVGTSFSAFAIDRLLPGEHEFPMGTDLEK